MPYIISCKGKSSPNRGLILFVHNILSCISKKFNMEMILFEYIGIMIYMLLKYFK